MPKVPTAHVRYTGSNPRPDNERNLAQLNEIIEPADPKYLIRTEPSNYRGFLAIRINVRGKAITSKAKNNRDLVCLVRVQPELGEVILITKVEGRQRQGRVGKMIDNEFVPR